MKKTLTTAMLLVLLLTACTAAPPEAAEPQPSVTIPLVPTETRIPSSTPSIIPSPSNTATATPLPAHPLSIEYLRQQDYPASEIVVEEVLEPGSNYFRYYVSYQSEGLKIYALMTLPYGDTPPTGWPAVVFNHGYIAPQHYRTTERYINYVDGFARNGYIVFRSDYRGHHNSEGQAKGAYRDPGYTIDVLNAVAALKNFNQADPNRIGMWGHSMGGFITYRAMVVDPDIKAGVIWAGVVDSYDDLASRWFRNWRGGPSFTDIYGFPEESPEFYQSISANYYLADLSGPLQLHHGTADETVPYQMSVNLAEQARAAGQIAELYLIKDDNHNLGHYFTTTMNRSIAFFDQYVKNIE